MVEKEIFVPESDYEVFYPEVQETKKVDELFNTTFLVHDFIQSWSRKYNRNMVVVKCSDLEEKNFFKFFSTSEPLINMLKAYEQKFKEGKVMKATLKKQKGQKGYYHIFV